MSSVARALPAPLFQVQPRADNPLGKALEYEGIRPFDHKSVRTYQRELSQGILPRWARWLPARAWAKLMYLPVIGFFLSILGLSLTPWMFKYFSWPYVFTFIGAFVGSALALLAGIKYLNERICFWETIPYKQVGFCPTEVQYVASRIAAQLPDATIEVERLKEDPFLVVRHGGRKEYVAFWLHNEAWAYARR